MAALCTVSGLVLDANGSPAAGAVIRLQRVSVAGAIDTDYHTQTTSSSTGAFSFSVPQGATMVFASNDVSTLEDFRMVAPNSVAFNLGNFRADVASEMGQRSVLGTGSVPSAVAPYVVAREIGDVVRQVIFTVTALPVTLVKNGTSSGGGGTKIYTFPVGLIQPVGGTTNLTIAAAGDASFLGSVGSAAAGTDGSLTGTEISFLPSTAATTTSGAGTCKAKSSSTTPTPGAVLDGTSTAIDVYLNSALNADATGIEALTFSGTITLTVINHGDN
jgi:hypothetical protein